MDTNPTITPLIARQLAEKAHPLASVTPGNGFEDLEWLKVTLKHVQYVALGEATHGTREFFQTFESVTYLPTY